MIELEFLGRSGDTRSVIFTDAEGERYSAVITDELRTALRRNPTVVDVRDKVAPVKATLRPAQIQALLREGMSAEDISVQQGIAVESITRYESPILAEKAWAISRAQQAPITVESGAPTLEDLVINRLAARGVDHRSLTWEALRRPGEDWEITLTFVQSAVERCATWMLTETSNQVVAVDQEAHWLTETASPITPVSAFLPPLAHPVGEEEQQNVEALLDEANSLRGRRQPLLDDIDGDFPHSVLPPSASSSTSLPFFSGRPLPFEKDREEKPVITTASLGPLELKKRKKRERGQAHINTVGDDLAGIEESGGTPDLTKESSVLTDKPDSLPSPKMSTPKKRSSKRRSVPSWDEIVFGAKSD